MTVSDTVIARVTGVMALHLRNHKLLADPQPFARLLELDGVTEELEIRSTFGFMAFHGGRLEEMTDDVARAAARRAGASLYAVVQPEEDQWHIPSHRVTSDQSPALAQFMDHVDVVVSLHGFGRVGLWRTLLVGGQNRQLAEHVAIELIPRLGHYEIVTDLDSIPKALRGLHDDNPVNTVKGGGVQIELPPRVRGRSPLFWGNRPKSQWVPHVDSLIDGLVAAATTWPTAGQNGTATVS